MRTKRFLPILALGVLMLLVGCAGKTQKDVVDLSINANQLYQKVRSEYKIAYDTSSKDTQKLLKKEVAPKIDAIGDKLHKYNMIVLRDMDDPQMKREILMDLISIKSELEEL
jgi:hypothetical protein